MYFQFAKWRIKLYSRGCLACEWQPAGGGSRHPAPMPLRKARGSSGDTPDVVLGQRPEQRASGRWRGQVGGGSWWGTAMSVSATSKGTRTHACVCTLPNNTCVRACVHVCSVSTSCPTLCNTVDCSPPGSSLHGDSPGKNTGVGCHALLQGIFPSQGSNLRLLRLLPCRRGRYQKL